MAIASNLGRGTAQAPAAAPPPFTLRTLGEDIPYDVRSNFQSCVAIINQLIAQVAQLQTTVATLTAQPLTAADLTQVQAALSATGSNPLNVTGLVGVPTATP